MSIDDTRRFLHALDSTVDDEYTFQTFDDDAERRLPALARTLHGTLDEHLDQLLELNQRGAGVFVTVQSTDLTGRKNENVLRVRALFADDDTPRDGVRDDLPLLPHIITESSKGKYHYYWLVDGCPLEDFKGMQQAIATVLDTDVAVNDLPRVMRLPGFLHRKGASLMSRVISTHLFEPYSFEQLQREFAARLLEMPPVPRETAPPALIEAGATVLADGERHEAYKQEAFRLRAKGLGANAIAAQLWDQDATNPINDGHTYIPSIANWTAQTFPPHYNGPKPDIAPAVDSIIDTMPVMNGHDAGRELTGQDYRSEPEPVKDYSLRGQLSELLATLGNYSHNRVATWAYELSDLDTAHAEIAQFRFEGPAADGQDMLRDIRHRATYRPVLGTVAMFTLLATALGRLYKSPTDVRSNIYIAGLAASGTGKQAAVDLVRDTLVAAGCRDLLMSAKFSSAQAVEEELGAQPNRLSLSNEIGQDLAGRMDPNSSNQALQRTLSAFLLDIYSDSSNPNYIGSAATSARKTRDSKYPCWTWGGFSVPDVFLAALRSGQITEGFLARMFIFIDKAQAPKHVDPLGVSADHHNPTRYTGPPRALVDLVARLRNVSAPGQNLAHVGSNEIDIPSVVRSFDWCKRTDAAALYGELGRFVNFITETPDKAVPKPWRMLVSRAPEQVQKLVMPVTASRMNGVGLEISTDDLTKAVRLFLACCAVNNSLVDSHMADSVREGYLKKIRRLVDETSGKYITWRELGRGLRGLESSDIERLVFSLCEFDNYQYCEAITTKRGKRTRYVAEPGTKLPFNYNNLT